MRGMKDSETMTSHVVDAQGGEPNRSVCAVTATRVERRINPLGIDALRPRFSWRLEDARRGTLQSAYELRVAESLSELKQDRLIWNSGKVASDQSIELPYAGPPLRSRQRCYWQVRVWDQEDAPSAWSAPACWEMGLLDAADWRAQWISPQIELSPAASTPAPILRSEFELREGIARARAYVTSLGLYELHLNGRRVGDTLFTPGWTSFGKRLQYQIYDVAALLGTGRNAVGAILGDGWYRFEPFPKEGRRNNGKPFAFLMQIEVTYEDGSTQLIVSDKKWKSSTSPILRSEIYNGEIYDARRVLDRWTHAHFDDSAWHPVALAEPSTAGLIATAGPAVRRIQALSPVKITPTRSGSFLVDMGQNMVGWVRLRAKGEAGVRISLRHAEVLDAHGALYTESLRTAEQRVEYILRGGGEEVFEPHFTFQGFRYVELQGYPGELKPSDIVGVVIHSDMEVTGALETSDPLLNQLQHNIVWTMKGNFLEVPTDCPQRDERLGWGFDAALFAPTAALNMDVSNFLAKWMADYAAEQTPDGSLPMEAPRTNFRKYVLSELMAIAGGKGVDDRLIEFTGVPGYGDAVTTVPWRLYLSYADTQVLERQYECMKRWVEFELAQTEAFIWTPLLSLGDWLDFNTTLRPGSLGSNAYDLMATAYLANSLDIVARSARILGKDEDATQFAALHAQVVDAFRARFVSSDGTVGDGAQVDYVLALDFDLVPAALQPAAARHLADEVRARGHLTTGIGGTPRLLNTLSRFGYDAEAYRLLKRQEMPSWIYQIANGATTVWERWDGIRPDGSFQDVRMNSFNHYALAAVGEWMFEVIGGIALDPASPGYKHILIQLRPGGRLTSARARLLTPYGEVSTSWWIEEETFAVDIVVPPNATASVRLPATSLDNVRESGVALTDAAGVRAVRQVGGEVIVEIGSGAYSFVCSGGPLRGSSSARSTAVDA